MQSTADINDYDNRFVQQNTDYNNKAATIKKKASLLPC
jgi:hypothetical protein